MRERDHELLETIFEGFYEINRERERERDCGSLSNKVRESNKERVMNCSQKKQI